MPNFLKMVLASMVGFFLCTVITFVCYFVLFLILGASLAGSIGSINTSFPAIEDMRLN